MQVSKEELEAHRNFKTRLQRIQEENYKTSSQRIYDLAKTLGHTLYISETAMDWIYENNRKTGESLENIIKKVCFENGKPKICRTERDKEIFRLRHSFKKDCAMWYGEEPKTIDNELKKLDLLIQKQDKLYYKKYIDNF